MSHDYDDGLVHEHRWATEPPAHLLRRREEMTAPVEPYDDGLVHGHAWAMGSEA